MFYAAGTYHPWAGPAAKAEALTAAGLALLAHVLLALALAWGVHWKSHTETTAFEAELWSQVPQDAAPAAPPEAPPVPVQAPVETPVKTPPVPDRAQDTSAADIALKQEKLRLRLEKKQEEQEAQEKKKSQVAKLALEQQRVQKERLETEKRRQEQMARINAQAKATGRSVAGQGTALNASGPSGSYAAKVSAKIKPNIVFTQEIVDNPTAEVEVRLALDGTIISQKLIKASGNPAWDEAALKAVIRTRTLPRDVDGTVQPVIVLSLRPRD